MSLFLRSLFLGYGMAASAAVWMSASDAAGWAVLLVAWIGGNVLGLAFTVLGAVLWPMKPIRRSSFTAAASEFHLWDDDLVRELIDAGLQRDCIPAPRQGLRLPETG